MKHNRKLERAIRILKHPTIKWVEIVRNSGYQAEVFGHTFKLSSDINSYIELRCDDIPVARNSESICTSYEINDEIEPLNDLQLHITFNLNDVKHSKQEIAKMKQVMITELDEYYEFVSEY